VRCEVRGCVSPAHKEGGRHAEAVEPPDVVARVVAGHLQSRTGRQAAAA
jgi:hypothetical protein